MDRSQGNPSILIIYQDYFFTLLELPLADQSSDWDFVYPHGILPENSTCCICRARREIIISHADFSSTPSSYDNSLNDPGFCICGYQLIMERSILLEFCAIFFVLYILGLYIYRAFFDSLSHIPGPELAAASLWYEFYYDVVKKDRYTFKLKELHAEYGQCKCDQGHPKDSTIEMFQAELSEAARTRFTSMIPIILIPSTQVPRHGRRSIFGRRNNSVSKRHSSPLNPMNFTGSAATHWLIIFPKRLCRDWNLAYSIKLTSWSRDCKI